MLSYIALAKSDAARADERRGICDTWIAAARDWASAAKNQDIANAVELVAGAALRLPGPADKVLYVADGAEQTDEHPKLFICPVLPSDEWLIDKDGTARDFLQPLSKAPRLGTYYKSTQTIYMAGWYEVSPKWMALMLIHEATHALDHSRGAPMGRPSEIRARAHQRECLVANLGSRLSWLRDLKTPTSSKTQQPTRIELSDDELGRFLACTLGQYELTMCRMLVGMCFDFEGQRLS